MYLGTIQENNNGNGRKPLLTSDNLQRVCLELGIPDDKHTLRRTARGFDLYFSGKVTHIRDHTFEVESQFNGDGRGIPYQVSISKANISYCTCADWMKNSGDTDYPDIHFHCKHAIAARIWLYRDGNGNGSKRRVNECGTERAKAIQDKLNGDNENNGNGVQPPSHQLDTSDPFQECESLDIDQIEERRNGELVHKLSNGEYVISYRGIMKLAEMHDIEFASTVHSDTYTVIAKARLNGSERISGKPINGSVYTASELAKRNAARQLLPYPEIKALEHKAKLESEFSWDKAKAKCLELVPKFKMDIAIHDLVQAGKLKQKHPSDYDRIEWLMIYNECKKDAETNGGGDNPSPSDNGWRDKLAECQEAAKNFRRYDILKSDLRREDVIPKEHPREWDGSDFATLKEACEIDASLFGKELGHWTVDIQPNKGIWAYQGRYDFWLVPMSQRCFWCGKEGKIMPDAFINWERYTIKTSLCLECSRTVDQNAIDQKFDEIYQAYSNANILAEPNTMDEFVERCKEAASEVVDDNPVDANTMPLENSDAKRVLKMNRKRGIWLEIDGKRTEYTMQDAARDFGSDAIRRLTQAVQLCGADIGVVELN